MCWGFFLFDKKINRQSPLSEQLERRGYWEVRSGNNYHQLIKSEFKEIEYASSRNKKDIFSFSIF